MKLAADETPAIDWARLDLNKFETVATLQLKALMTKADYAMKMAEVQEQLIKNERDEVKLQILKDGFADFKHQRYELVAAAEEREVFAAKVTRHSEWLRKIQLGEAMPQTMVTHMWSAFYFFIQKTPEPKLTVPHGVRPHQQYKHEPPLSKDIPSTAIGSPYAYVLWLRSQNLMPRLGTMAMAFLYQIVEAMLKVAAADVELAEQELATYELKLTQLRAAGPLVGS